MKEFIKNLKFTWNYAKHSKKPMIIFTLSHILQILINVVTPLLSAKIVIELTTNNYTRLLIITIILFITDCLHNITMYIGRILGSKIYRETMTYMAFDLGKQTLKIETKCLDEHTSGLFIQRLTSDTSKLSTIYGNIIASISNILKYIGLLGALFIVNKQVFLFETLFMILIFILQRKKTHEEKIRDKVYRKKNEKITGLVGELVRGARDIKMLNSEDDFLDELNKKIKETNEERYIMNRKTFRYSFKIVFTKDIEKLLLLIMLILQMKSGMIIPAMALVVYNYANSLGSSTNTLDQIFELIRDFNLSSERIKEIMDDDKFKKEKFGTKHLKKVKGNFEFKNVSFGYNDKLILKDLSFKIKENETVAFVGKSGAGKTTIFNLLCKMYDINEGTITIDRININDLDKDSIRGNITIISQNPYIFNMSIKDNLRLVKKDLTDKEMIKACEIACLDEFINELPDKYDTIIGEGGVNLSGGQKQRLAIARALVQKTEIILFDEATSALDNITQEKITNALNNMKNEYTILIIAHRLSTIQNADRILYIEDGKIQKEGTHKYLLKNCKEYKELYETEIKNN